MLIQIVSYKQKEILSVDYSSCSTQEEIMDLLDQVLKKLQEHTGDARLLVDVTGKHGTKELIHKEI